MRWYIRLALAIAGIAGSLQAVPAYADTFCSGTVSRVLVYNDGKVLIVGSWRGDYTTVCNVSTTWNGVSPSICVSWLAQLNAATTMNKTAVLYYVGVNDCATLLTYSNSPAPLYIGVAAS